MDILIFKVFKIKQHPGVKYYLCFYTLQSQCTLWCQGYCQRKGYKSFHEKRNQLHGVFLFCPKGFGTMTREMFIVRVLI